MRDTLPQKPRLNETGIVNLDRIQGEGTHWVAYKKFGKKVYYFDSFGDLRPPIELVKYLGNNIQYNTERQQRFDSVLCGHLCLKFLCNVLP